MQGLLPPRETSLQAEITRAHAAISRCCTALDKYQVSRQGTLTGVHRISPLSFLPTMSCMCAQGLAMRHLPAQQQIPIPRLQAVMGLREASWDIFYGLLSQHIKEYLPIIYTP